jgi:hypothetical protein
MGDRHTDFLTIILGSPVKLVKKNARASATCTENDQKIPLGYS